MAYFLQCSRPYRRLVLRYTLALALILVVFCFNNWPPTAFAHQDHKAHTTRDVLQDVMEDFLIHDTEALAKFAEPQTPLQDQPETTSSPQVKKQAFVTLQSEFDWNATSGQIDAWLSDEFRMAALLSPLAATGEPLLRDMSHRVRAFKEVFQIWENLHLIEEEGGLRQRSVITYLRSLDLPSRSLAHAIQSYDRLRQLTNTFAKLLFPWTMLSHPDHMSLHSSFYDGGRGIVFTAGDEQAELLLTVIPSLRVVGCELPIEVMYLGDADSGEEMRDLLESFPGVVTRDLTAMIDDAGWHLAGWAAKPFAILMSSFRESIFIDADSFFLTNPVILFDDEGYHSTGALFFKDRILFPENKRKWITSVLPGPLSANIKRNRMWTGESGHMQESGVIVVDKWKHFIPLLLATFLNGPVRDSSKELGKKGVYEMMYGDKESYWLSWEMAGSLDYTFYDGVTGTMGMTTGRRPVGPKSEPKEEPAPVDGAMVCSSQLVHFDQAGKPLWFNGWIAASKNDRGEWQQFDVYIREPHETGKKNKIDAWTLHEANVFCLEAEEATEFTPKEKSILDLILDLAKESSKMFDDG